MALIGKANKIWIKSFKGLLKLKKVDYLRINSKLSPVMSILVKLTWSTITYINSIKTILPVLKLLGQTEFRLRPFFFEIVSIFGGNNIKEG